MKRLACASLLFCIAFSGCGSSTEVKAPEKFLPPTSPAGTGSTDGDDKTAPKEKFVP